jgi:periplasmic divalent cation tolerance protein
MNFQQITVMTSCPDAAVAERLGEAAVTERLAACAQIQPCRSIFRWNGTVQRESEYLLVLKTAASRWPQLETRLRALHPYEVPEIIALPIVAGSAEYLAWIDMETGDGHANSG